MPRLPRLELPGIPLHVTQRGVNRCAIFLDDDDRHHYRRVLREAARRHAVAIHAFVLMDNHVHLLLSANRSGDISQTLRRAGQTYVQSFNQRHGRVGTLWQGRFKSCLVDSDAYVLRVIRYIELNPVRAAMVERPEDFRWSSVHTHLDRARDPLIVPHPVYQALGSDPASRAVAYHAWLDAPIDAGEVARIRAYLTQEKALGEPRFQAMVEKALNRPVALRPRGRPRAELPAGGAGG
ncbi:transposase [Luteimonas viscosa]|uniref:Transposase n=1 Tax=Luteimonas viscosa TaxID=1132694 RepID=A0A5D4XSP8_9GAMM|nr:transposase [Luteimonas viscosa]TYT27616.1 transposase [Luteimonas viscosa]